MVLAILVGSRHYIGDGAYYTLAWVHYTLLQSMLTTVVGGAYWAPEHTDYASDWVCLTVRTAHTGHLHAVNSNVPYS